MAIVIDGVNTSDKSAVVITTATHTLAVNDNVVTVTYAGACTLTLPDVANAKGKTYEIAKDSATNIGTNDVTIQCARSDAFIDTTIDYTLQYQYQKCSVTSDGSNWILSEGETAWDDFRVAVNAVKIGGGTPTWANFPTATASFTKLLSFGVGDSVYFTIQMPHCWQQGTSIQPHVHWCPSANTGAVDKKVKWQLEYSWANIGDTMPAGSTITGEETINDNQDKHIMTNLDLVTATGKTFSSMIVCTLSRVAATADEFGSDVLLLEFDLHYRVNSRGSPGITSK